MRRRIPSRASRSLTVAINWRGVSGTAAWAWSFKRATSFSKPRTPSKLSLPDLVGNDPMLVTRFRQEALAAAAIRHQNIIAVTDFGVARGTMPFLVMEFVKGKSLHDILAAEGPLSPGSALEIMSAVGAGVAAAHRQNIVHRDLKPLNIMIQEDMPINEAVKVLDFGSGEDQVGRAAGLFRAGEDERVDGLALLHGSRTVVG